MSRREGVTLFMTLLAGFQLLLSRHSGQSDIATGSPIAGRTRTEIEGLIGFFANTLVLRTDLSGGPVFRELLGRVREMTLTAYAHQDVPFEKLVEELQPDRDLSRSPLFQAMFLLQNAPSMDLQLPGLKLSLMDRVAETVHFELLLSASETNGRIGGGLSYRTNLFGEGSIRRLLGHWQNLLASIVNSPQKRIGELTMLSEAELRQIVEEWNRTETEYRQLWVHEMVAEHAAKTPTVVAVEYAGQQLSYGELNQHANQLAHYLKKMGAGPEGLVAICVERSLEMTVGVLAILKTGAAYVPLDPKYPSSRLSYMLENSRIKLLVTQEQFLDTFASGVKSTICLDSEWQKISEESQANLNVDVDSDNVAFVIYTSGSTGWPKGVALRHGQVANLVHWHLQRSSGNPPLRTLQFASLSFDVSFQDIFATWCAGGCLVLIEEDTRRDPSELWRALCDQKVERVSLPFVALQQLAEVAARTERAASLRELISAGEQLKITPALQKLFNQLPTCVLENQYGPSETHVVTTYRAGRDPGEWTLLPPIGKPTANTQVYLLNEECLSVPVGVAGELYLGGAQLARGYVNRPELTAERFLPNPFSKEPGGRLYKTGDLARYLKDGNVEYMGRVDSQVKIRGYRVEVGEVESALSECEGVGQAAVVVREDRPGEKRLVAYVVSRDGQQLSESKLRSDLKDRLPEFMVPAAVVVMEQLTLTPSGKVDRKRLPDPGRSLGEKEEQYVGPRNATEEILCGIWEDLLKREPIGVTRNFFEVGGHSLLAMQLMARIGDALQVDLPVRRLFEAPTVMELARVIEQLTAAGGREKVLPIVRAPRDQEIPLSFAQQRLWFLDQLQPGSASYNLPAALRLSGAIRSDLVEYVFRELTRRHEALRTTFSVQEGQPIQIIAPVEAMSFSMLLTDLSGLPEEVGEAEAKRLAEEEAGQPFDLNRGPLLRVKLVRLAEQEHVLLVTMHHIVSDGWSIGIMVREFIQLYEAYAKGEERLLPELPIQYADFSVWQREWLQGAILEEQVQYWMQQLAGVQALELPTDRPRPAVMSHAGASVEFSLGSAQMEHLKGLSRRQGTSLYMVFLAAFQTLLFRYSGQQDIAVGSPIAGRRRTETEGLIGFFVNTLVMRTDVSGGLGFTELLRQVREVALEAYTHQDVPFEKVVEELQPERDLSRTPLFQVMFALQNAPQSELQLGAVKLRPFNVDNQTAKFDLSMALSEDGEKLQGWVGYNAALFELATVARMIEHYCVLLSGIVQNPEQSIAELPLLGQAERQQLLVEWNKTAVYHPQKCLPEMFEEQVATTPAAVAVEYEGRDLTYAELNRCANQLGHYLRKLGVGPEVRVGICIERGLNMVIGLLAVLKAGGAYVPLDPNYPPERLAYMQEDAQAPVLLTQERLGGNLPVSRQRVVCLDRDWEQIAAYPETNPHPAAFPENLAYVIYTSGSTGKPKGVCIAHGSACNLAVAQAKVFSVKPGDSVLQFASLNFDASVWEWLMALLSGARLVLAGEQTLLPGQAFAELLERESVSVATLPPSILAALPQTDLPRLQTLIVAGEMCGANLVEQWAAGRLMFNAYGPTEVTVCATISDPLLKAGGAPIGKPIANAQVYVLDGFMEAVPVGVMGELYIGGAGLARGYMNRPEITAEKFVPNPFAGRAGERLYRTGDLVKWRAEGNLEYLGRMDHQVKVRGFRIELGEIEAMLVQQNEVEQAVVMVREDEPGEKRLVAYMVTREEIAASELRERLKQRLPNYMVPSAFVNLAAMPLTPNGKVDRLALSKNFRAEQMHERTYIAPRTVTEEVVAQIWSELLKVERIGMNDSFFALGGHSLLVFRLKTMMQSRLGCDLPLSSLFQDPTISGLAKLLETPANEPSSPILAPMQTNGSSAPFFCVHPVGGQVVCYADLSRELGQNQPFYGLQSPDPSQTQVATIEHMASLYIQEIRHIQPSGPYLLGGWSMGGLVAFEMAHQLIDQRETIDLLTLFDMVPPSEFSGEIEPKRSFSMLERFALDMARLVLRNADELREHFLQLGPEEQFKLILDVLVREGVLPEASGQFELNRLLDIFTRNASAVENYRLRPMKQRIVLFAAAGREDPEQLAEKWEPWTTGGVELRAVQGDHYTILKPPHVATIASDLKHYLKSEHAVAVSQ
ncbi:MAG TPA: amino acid adenylation domain-containing protein [Candidatus Angelobacter sp.]|nr:amino acid adenylation domain-containing protein [Candidatus Angelobacter sp.]